jgi:hypothetical protein
VYFAKILKQRIFFKKGVLQFQNSIYICTPNAKVAQLVEHDLAKVGVAGSNPVFRSEPLSPERVFCFALVVESVDTRDLKSRGQ